MAKGIKWWDEVKVVQRPTISTAPVLVDVGYKALVRSAKSGTALRMPKSRLQSFNMLYNVAREHGYRMRREVNGQYAYLWWEPARRRRRKAGKK